MGCGYCSVMYLTCDGIHSATLRIPCCTGSPMAARTTNLQMQVTFHSFPVQQTREVAAVLESSSV
jgi:hypothetical protein